MPKFKVQVQLDYLPRYCKTVELEIEADDGQAAEDQATESDFSKEFLDLDAVLDYGRKNWDLDDSNEEISVADCEQISPEEEEEEPASD